MPSLPEQPAAGKKTAMQTEWIVPFEIFKCQLTNFPVFNLTAMEWRVTVQQAMSDGIYSSLLGNCKELPCAQAEKVSD